MGETNQKSFIEPLDHMDGFSDALEYTAQMIRQRRKWVPVLRSFITNVTDQVGSWLFYFHAVRETDLGIYQFPLLFFNLLSGFLGLLTLADVVIDALKLNKSSSRLKMMKKMKKHIRMVLTFEILIEDIPLIVLTSVITSDINGGVWSPQAVFNITTSSFNLLFNILDMWVAVEDEEERIFLEQQKKQAGNEESQPVISKDIL